MWMKFWLSFGDSSKTIPSDSANKFDSLTEKKKKNYAKLLKKTCRTRWLSLHAGVDASFGESKGFIYTLKEMQNDKESGSTASGLLQSNSHYEFLGTLYLLKNILPSLTGLNKTFQTESLNFLRISPAINRCKSKILEVKIIESFNNLNKIQTED